MKENVQMEQNVQSRKKSGRKPYKNRLFLLGAAAVLLLGSITAIAYKEFDFAEHLRLDESQNIGGIFQSDIKVKVEKEPRLSECFYKGWVETWEISY